MPRVSIVIPTRNRPDLLGDALGSVLRQDFRDFEVVVVDDASDWPEKNAQVMAQFDWPIRYIRRERHGGPAAARNTGIQCSDSEYVAFLDDDDLWLPSKLTKQLTVFEANPRGLERLGVVYCGHEWIEIETGQVQFRRMPRIETIEDLLEVKYNIIPTILIKRQCIEEVGNFDESLPFQENLEFLSRVIHCFRFDRVEEVLAVCRSHAGPRTGDSPFVVIAGYERFLERTRGMVLDQTVLHGEYYRLARCLMGVGNMRAARRNLMKAIRLAPGLVRLQYSVFLGLSFLAKTLKTSYRNFLASNHGKVPRIEP